MKILLTGDIFILYLSLVIKSFEFYLFEADMIDDMNDESSNKSKFAGLCFDKLWTFNELFKGCSPLTR